MCGIVGACGPRAGEPSIKLLELLAHRGPDAAAHHSFRDGWMGQTRLAVVDLVTGDPPITNEDATIAVALNGEIYNFRELRETLVSSGHSFRTLVDTEVIAHLAEGSEANDLASRLEGMFALAVWDERRGTLVLARDRFGKKPLYYWTDGENFVFASEIKAILAHPVVPNRMEPSALDAYLTFGYVPTPMTFFEGIRSVPPGHTLRVEPGKHAEILPYWQLPRGEPSQQNVSAPADTARELRRLLEAAVERRLVSDVPLGAFLSGGIDSSAVVAVMARLSDNPVRTFTIGFDDEEGFDERRFAKIVSQRYSTEHTEFVVEPHAVDLIEELVWHHDQPFGDSSAIPTYLLSQLTRDNVTVAMSGDGGDELFAGYERFLAARLVEPYKRLPRIARKAVESAAGFFPASSLRGRVGSLQRFAMSARKGLPDAYLDWLSFTTPIERQSLRPDASDWGFEHHRHVWHSTRGTDLDRLLQLNVRTYLLDDLLVKVDRMSMAHALEVRSPFLDRELAEFAFRLPDSLRMRGMKLKWILKRAVQDLLPNELLNRRKRGFGVPIDRWFRTDLRDYVASTIGSGNARTKRYLEGAAVDSLIAQHNAGAKNHANILWALLTLEVFLRKQGW